MISGIFVLSPLGALFVDALGTVATQFGYVSMKIGQISKEKQASASRRLIQSGYCTCYWIFGFLLVNLGCVIHAYVLPFADMVLLSCNTATAIISSSLFAICFLGEHFNWRYDLVALSLIVVGNTLTVLQTNKEAVDRDSEEIIALLRSKQSVLFFAASAMIYGFTLIETLWLLGKVEEFELDCDEWLAGNQIMTSSLSSTADLLDQEFGSRVSATQHKRPTRALISLITNLPRSLIQEISPRSASLHTSIKLPMILLTWTCGLMVACNLVFMKCFGEVVKAGQFTEMPVFAGANFFLGTSGCFVMIYVLNVAMQYYDNLDVMPIFQSFILLMMIVSGWVVFDEIKFYTPLQMLGILSSSLVVCAGIKILTMKKSLASSDKQTQLEDHFIRESASGFQNQSTTTNSPNTSQLLDDKQRQETIDKIVKVFGKSQWEQ